MPEDPSFADVFDDGLFTEESVPAGSALDPEQVFTDATATDAETVGTHVERPQQARFDGDTSALPAEVCWTLQELVAAPHVTDKSKKHWPIVLQYEQVLRSRLSELGLVLEVNREHRYAFTQQAEDPSPHSRTILRARTLSLAASALALYLYQQYLVASDDPVVSATDMIDHMLAYKRAEDTDEAAFQKKVRTAIKSLDDASIIKQIKGTDRYLIYPVITSVLTADRVEALTARYQAIASGDPGGDADGDADGDTDGDAVEDDDE